jgi:hypothetical protein
MNKWKVKKSYIPYASRSEGHPHVRKALIRMAMCFEARATGLYVTHTTHHTIKLSSPRTQRHKNVVPFRSLLGIAKCACNEGVEETSQDLVYPPAFRLQDASILRLLIKMDVCFEAWVDLDMSRTTRHDQLQRLFSFPETQRDPNAARTWLLFETF